MVKQFDRTPQGEVRVAFNPGVDLGPGRETTLEYAIRIAASLAQHCFREGRGFRMWPGPAKANLTSWRGVLEHLARIQAEPQSSVGELLHYAHLPGVSVIVVAAADEDTLRLLRQHRHSSPNLTVVMTQGFDSQEDGSAGDKLANVGLNLVPCKINELPQALAALGRALSPETGDRIAEINAH